MKHFSLVFVFLTLAFLQAAGQETPVEQEDYYRQRPDTTTPTIRKTILRREALKQKDLTKIKSRWYIGADLFGRSDESALENNYQYLFKSNAASTIDFSFSGQVGWVFREQLAVEGGYARSAIHNVAYLNTTNKGGFKFKNEGNAFFLRTKFLIEFQKTGLRRPGLWIGAGAWAVPNTGGEREKKAYIIYRYDQRGNTDTTYISSKTTLSNNWTYGLEASVEYTFKVAESADLAFFVRRHWGYGTAITTELTYADNKKILDTGYIRSNGTGWNFGLSLRFMTGIKRGEMKADRENGVPWNSPTGTFQN